MSVSVEFRGNFLLVGRDGKLEEIILPNCDTNDQRNLKRRGRLIRRNRKHHAGMVVAPAKGGWRHRRWSRDDSVSIGSPTDDNAPDIQRSILRGLPNLEGHSLSIQTGTVAARIRLGGGTLQGFPPAKADNPKFRHPQAKGDLCLSVVWTLPDADSLEVRVNNKKPIAIQATDTVIIYSFDHRDPTPEQLRGERDMPVEHDELHDHDFEWLYQLYASPPATPLVPTAPAPRKKGTEVGALTFNVSSCFPGGDIQPPDA